MKNIKIDRFVRLKEYFHHITKSYSVLLTFLNFFEIFGIIM
ncbi:conserved hypothetical protein [Bacillus subtilis]